MNDIQQYFGVIFQKSLSDFKAEARKGSLGVLWWFIEPIIYLGVFYLVFKVIFNRGDENFMADLLIGLVVWRWFSATIMQSSNCIVSNVNLMRQVYQPKVIFPAMVIVTSTMKFLIVFAMLLLFLVIIGHPPQVSWLSIPFLMALQFLMMFSIGTIVASIIPFIPDMRMIIDNAMTLVFFMSGIFFDINTVPEAIRGYLYINPMVSVIESYRAVLIDGHWPSLIFVSLVSILSVLGLVLGCYLLKRFDKQYLKII